MLRRVLVADDHPLCSAALTLTVHSIDSAVVVDTAVSIAEVERALVRERYDALFLDLALKDSQGLANLSMVRNLNKDIPVLVVSGKDRGEVIARVKSLGARGFLSKSASVAVMKEAVDAVLGGATYFPDLPDAIPEDADQLSSAIERLSPAQTKVVIELAKGHSNKVIADDLDLSEATVKSHMSAIFKVLGVTNRAQAIIALQESSANI